MVLYTNILLENMKITVLVVKLEYVIHFSKKSKLLNKIQHK